MVQVVSGAASSGTGAKALLRVEGLEVGYRTAGEVLPVVMGATVSVKPGELVALVGESGCGKSTLARAIAGLLPKPSGQITGGRIYLGDVDLVSVSRRQSAALRRGTVGVVLQQAMNALNPTRQVGRQIGDLLRFHHGMNRDDAARDAVRCLAQSGVADPARIARAYPFELSGGMRQRAVLAMALSCRPRLLIADEPTTALDTTTQLDILDTLQGLIKEQDMAVLLITHDLGVVAHVADFVSVMYAGKIIEEGRVSSVFEAPTHPYTIGLLNSTPDLSLTDFRLPMPIAGNPPEAGHRSAGCAFAPRCSRVVDICKNEVPVLREHGSAGGKSACWVASTESGP